ncbi:MAG: hypothetical protein U0667_05060 [Chloroflexota bacterium]
MSTRRPTRWAAALLASVVMLAAVAGACLPVAVLAAAPDDQIQGSWGLRWTITYPKPHPRVLRLEGAMSIDSQALRSGRVTGDYLIPEQEYGNHQVYEEFASPLTGRVRGHKGHLVVKGPLAIDVTFDRDEDGVLWLKGRADLGHGVQGVVEGRHEQPAHPVAIDATCAPADMLLMGDGHCRLVARDEGLPGGGPTTAPTGTLTVRLDGTGTPRECGPLVGAVDSDHQPADWSTCTIQVTQPMERTLEVSYAGDQGHRAAEATIGSMQSRAPDADPALAARWALMMERLRTDQAERDRVRAILIETNDRLLQIQREVLQGR